MGKQIHEWLERNRKGRSSLEKAAENMAMVMWELGMAIKDAARNLEKKKVNE